jgi:hypothetical protein
MPAICAKPAESAQLCSYSIPLSAWTKLVAQSNALKIAIHHHIVGILQGGTASWAAHISRYAGFVT